MKSKSTMSARQRIGGLVAGLVLGGLVAAALPAARASAQNSLDVQLREQREMVQQLAAETKKLRETLTRDHKELTDEVERLRQGAIATARQLERVGDGMRELERLREAVKECGRR